MIRNLSIISIGMLLLPTIAHAQVSIVHKPIRPVTEMVDGQTVANFDLIIENTSTAFLSD